jgi:hypothetical protein
MFLISTIKTGLEKKTEIRFILKQAVQKLPMPLDSTLENTVTVPAKSTKEIVVTMQIPANASSLLLRTVCCFSPSFLSRQIRHVFRMVLVLSPYLRWDFTSFILHRKQCKKFGYYQYFRSE